MLQCTANQLPARLVPPAPKGKGASARLSAYRAANACLASGGHAAADAAQVLRSATTGLWLSSLDGTRAAPMRLTWRKTLRTAET
jgi:hypothetical protein